MATLLVGLGNPILTDDGVGVLVARGVEQALAKLHESEVEVVEASIGGLRLMEMMVGYERVILVDALLGSGKPPGTVQRMKLEDVDAMTPTQHLASAHDATLQTALEAGRRMGLSLPEDVIVFAVSAQNVVDFGDQPTPAVQAAVPIATAAVVADLTRPAGSTAAEKPAAWVDHSQPGALAAVGSVPWAATTR